MTSQKRINANRRNAQKSTGPRSVQGKRRASRNAAKHGLLGRLPTLIGENLAAYELLVIETIERYGAETRSEVMLAQSLADDLFWLDRCARARTQLIRYRGIKKVAERDVSTLEELEIILSIEKDSQNKVTPSSNGAAKTVEQNPKDHRKQLWRNTNEQLFRRILYLSDSDDKVADNIIDVIDDLEKLDRYETTRFKSLEKKERLLTSMIARRQEHEKE